MERPNNIVVIDLQCPTADCCICGEVSIKSGIPIYEDLILPNDWKGEWGGVPACDRCRDVQSKITKPMTRREFSDLVTAEETCCCGEPMSDHHQGSSCTSPKSIADYARELELDDHYDNCFYRARNPDGELMD